MSFLYQNILKPVLFLFDAEKVHNLFIVVGEYLGKSYLGRKIINILYGSKEVPVTVDGLTFRTPVLLAAGFDYNGRLTEVLPYLSFGGVEVGSVTAKECQGNPKPRLTRLKKSKSILVNKGLKNEGVDLIIKRLGERKRRIQNFVIGVSIARTNCQESSGVAEGVEDYYYSMKRLVEENIGDYYTLNISCPNAFGGETYTKPKLLTRLLSKLQSVETSKPVYVKMPINLEWRDFQGLLEVIKKYSYIKGVIIGNLNKNYIDLPEKSEIPPEYKGGLSGLPTKELSDKLIKQTRQYLGNEFTIIGCGGVLSVKDAQEKIDAGADLIQLITGMIYTGPGLIRDICHNLKYEK